jgi:hypothetical protein
MACDVVIFVIIVKHALYVQTCGISQGTEKGVGTNTQRWTMNDGRWTTNDGQPTMDMDMDDGWTLTRMTGM